MSSSLDCPVAVLLGNEAVEAQGAAKVGTRVTYALSAPGSVGFAVEAAPMY